jgi:hypothetical protein
MNISNIIKTFLAIGILAVCLFGQSKISAQCRQATGYTQGVFTQTDGNLFAKTCPNGDVLINNLNGSFKLQDIDYVPFAGSLNADVLFSNSSNDNVQNNAGVITTNNNFVGMSNDLKIVASGAAKWYIGSFNQLRASGATTGNGYFIGGWDFVVNRGLGGSPYVYGRKIDINLEGNATESVGLDVTNYRGSAVTNPLFIGGRFQAANGYVDADFVTGVESVVKTVSTGANIGLGRGLISRFQITSGHTATSLIGLHIGSWTNAGTVTNARAIYIDNTISIGSNNNAIVSDSTAPSYLAGSLSLNGAAKFYITTPQTPSSATEACTVGQQAWDTSFYYVCISTNTWKRATLSTW